MAVSPKTVASYSSSEYSDTQGGENGQPPRTTSSSGTETERDSVSLLLKTRTGGGATEDARAAEEPLKAGSQSSGSPSSGSDAGFDFDLGLSTPTQRPCSPLPFAPAISSPLNPASSASASSASPEGKEAQASDETQANTNRPRAAAGRQHIALPLPPRPPYLRTAQIKSTPDLLGQRASDTPLTLHDLGTDYTRYFNPFSDGASTPSRSRRTSLSERRSHGKLRGAPRTTTPPPPLPPTNPFLTPTPSATGLSHLYDAEKNVSFIDDRLTAPYEEKGLASWPLVCDQDEADDEMHMPRDDDDLKFKPKIRDHFTPDSIASTIGLAFMIVGLSFIFIGLPVLSAVGIIDYNSAYGMPLSMFPNPWRPQVWATVNNKKYPLLANIRTGLIDPDTPEAAKTKTGEFGDEYVLVFSDEFNESNRTFYEGDDPYFFAPDIWYGATRDREWYDPDAVTTSDGTLQLRLEEFFNHDLMFRSGMLNSWNQLCFKGGIFEVSVSLPGPAGIPGLWPGAWTMGNLGRPGYLSTTEGLWPYTYQACDAGITPNQSSYDGLSYLPGQRLNSCTCPGEDHPTPGTGRGAPEIDIIEVGANNMGLPIATQSYQVAPFDVNWYPNYNYTAFPDRRLSGYNTYTGGPFQQAISATTILNRDWYDNKQYQRYSFEYVPGEGKDAFISWKVGDQTMFMLDGRAVGENGNIKARQIAQEPMSIILNLGLSDNWTWISWKDLIFPTIMRFDYIRWYQKKGEEMVTCDPPGFETTEYIKKHPKAYNNVNHTTWDHTGYGWPKHKLNKFQYIRDVTGNAGTYDSLWLKTFPIFGPHNPNITCGRGAYPLHNAATIQTATIPAGSSVGFMVSGPWYEGDSQSYIYHEGPGQVFLSKLPDDVPGLVEYDGSGEFFKIHYVGPANRTTWATEGQLSIDFVIPAATPSGDYLMRVEQWFPSADLGQSQWFVSCAHVRIVGGGVGTPGPMVRFPNLLLSEDSPSVWFQTPGDLELYVEPLPEVWEG
ncbi:SKN1-domain-containing protein [Decorospora gaudefroyi]|uniref:AA9 family lytic polysaccharide monooxygenase n=1 Tax=Decorospora gaudefroyi TaxID=184978 RepID=A0A6A5KV82_9PLEO|nr:SKN1-domain-containing protein [Decorospora gaudefroyi]